MTIGAPSPGMPFWAPTQYLPYTPIVVGGRRRRTDRSRAIRSVQHPPEEAAQVSRDDVQVALQKEVTAVDQVHFRVFCVAGEGSRAAGPKISSLRPHTASGTSLVRRNSCSSG